MCGRAQGVWHTGREYPAHAFDGLGHAVAVAEDGDEAPQVVGRTARVVAGDESPHPGPGPACQVGLDTGDGDHRGAGHPPLATACSRPRTGRGGRHPRGGHPAGRGGLRSPSNAEYHAATPAARPGRPGPLGRRRRRRAPGVVSATRPASFGAAVSVARSRLRAVLAGSRAVAPRSAVRWAVWPRRPPVLRSVLRPRP